MVEEFVNKVMINLSSILDSDTLSEVMKQINIVANDYEMTKKSTDIVPYQGYLPDCYKVYMVTKKIEGASDGSLNQYRMRLENFFHVINKPLEEITSNDIRVYLFRYQEARKVSNTTLNHIRVIIVSFFEWATNENYLDKNPGKNIKPIKDIKKPIDVLSDTELEMIRMSYRNPKDKMICEVLYSTGLRISEFVSLNYNDVLNKNEATIIGKGGKYRTVYFNAKAKLAIKEYMLSRDDGNPALVVSDRSPHQRLTKDGVERIVKIIGEKANLGRRLKPHMFRHTTGTTGMKRGMPLQEVSKMLGHSNINTTITYYAKVSQSDIENSHEKYIV